MLKGLSANELRRPTIPFLGPSLNESDPDVMDAIRQEETRQQTQIELIASENIVSKAVLEAVGTVPHQ